MGRESPEMLAKSDDDGDSPPINEGWTQQTGLSRTTLCPVLLKHKTTGDHLRAFKHTRNLEGAAPGDDPRTFGVYSEATGDPLQACGYLSKTFSSLVCFTGVSLQTSSAQKKERRNREENSGSI